MSLITNELESRMKASFLVVNCTIKSPPKQKTDRKRTDETLAAANAAEGSGKFTANIWGGRGLAYEQIKQLTSLQNAVKKVMYKHTKRLGGIGYLLPNAKLFDFEADVAKAEHAVAKHLAQMEVIYPQMVSEAKQVIQDLQDQVEYPSWDEFAERVSVQWRRSPVPSTTDVAQLQVPADVTERFIKESIHQREQDLVELSEGLYESLTKTVKRLAEQTSLDKGPTGKAKQIGSTLLPNVLELCEQLRDFNLTDDPALEAKRQALLTMITRGGSPVTTKALREDTAVRETVHEQASELMEDILGEPEPAPKGWDVVDTTPEPAPIIEETYEQPRQTVEECDDIRREALDIADDIDFSDFI